MKTSVVAPQGVSPPVITEFLQYIDQVLGQQVTDVILMATKEPMVLESVELVKVAVKRCYPYTHVHVIELPFSDIGSSEDNFEFMNICANILREQREVHHVDLIYLCVAGGRKDMYITLSLLSQYFGVNGVFHLIMPNVKSFNIKLERRRQEIKELAKALDKEGYYERYREFFDVIMYPPLSTYTVIKIPIVPYPRSVLNMLTDLLRRMRPQNSTEVPLSFDILKALETSGLIKVTSRKIYVTDEGRSLGKIIAQV